MLREEQEQEALQEFCERTVQASFFRGTEKREIQALFYQGSNLGYTQLLSGFFLLMLSNGYALCRYKVSERWQIEEVCRRIAPQIHVEDPDQVYEIYQREHSGEKLVLALERLFNEVCSEAVPSHESLSEEAQIEALKDFVLDRDTLDHLPLSGAGVTRSGSS